MYLGDLATVRRTDTSSAQSAASRLFLKLNCARTFLRDLELDFELEEENVNVVSGQRK
jgi:hypothetical protein